MRQTTLKIIFLIFYLGLNITLVGQESHFDSLKLLLHTAKDSFKIETLKAIGDDYFEENFDSTLHYYQLTLDACQDFTYFELELSTLRSFGYVYSLRKNDFETALVYFDKALELTREVSDSISMAYVLSDIGRIHWKQGNAIEATEYHLQVKKIGEELNNPKVLLRSSLSLGIIENENGHNEKAKAYYRMALKMANSLDSDRNKGLILNNLGKAYQDDAVYDTAFYYFERADSIFKNLEDSGWLSLTSYNKGENYTLQDNPTQGIEWFTTALNYNKTIGNQEREVMILLGLAKAYQKLNQPNQAIKTSQNALSILQQIDVKYYFVDLYQILAENYELIGKDHEALENYRKYIAASKEENLLEQSKKIAALNHRYELQKKENEILALKTQDLIQEQNLKKSRFYVELMIWAFCILLLLSILFFYHNKLKELRRNDNLKSSLSKDLHDNIGASLSHIKLLSNRLNQKSLPEKEKNTTISRIKNISNQLMYDMYDMIWSLDTQKDSIGNLFERMQDHADNTLGDFNIPYKFKIDIEQQQEKLQPKERINIYLIFKEAINNILKHTTSEEVIIKLSKDKNNRLHMTIINFYQHKKDNPSTYKKGLANMKVRTEEIGGNLSIEDETGKFIIEFSK